MELKGPFQKIIHVDMDAFYASVEQLDNPELRGKPIAVGGNSKRGVVSAASYEARLFGVRSAMSSVIASRNCPDLIFVKPRFDRYTELSKRIRSIFYQYTDLVEPLSLDEAYLDVTTNKKGQPSATLIAKDIRNEIYNSTGLTASAGISINKFVAKIASDYNKPNGQKTVPPEEVLQFLEDLDIRKFYGIGKVTAKKMYELGIFTGADLKSKPLEFLSSNFGKSGSYYFHAVRGLYNSPVKANRTRKSLAAERTFSENIASEIFMLEKLEHISNEVSRRLKKQNVSGKTITLKIKYSDFTLQTRSLTLAYFVNDEAIIYNTSKDLLFKDVLQNSVRLLGVSVSNLNTIKKERQKNKQIIRVQLEFEF